MKLLFMAVLNFAAIAVKANNYYFSSRNGNDSRTEVQARKPATPWKTLDKLNASMMGLHPGDSILLERGGVFDGSVTIGLVGAPGLPVVISAYGRGDNPVINGFFMLSHWSQDGNGIWKAACSSCGARINMVTLHDSVQPMGRYPNADDADKGYLKIQTHNKNSSFTDSSLSPIPDWTGGEVVIRKNRYIIDHSRITTQKGNLIF